MRDLIKAASFGAAILSVIAVAAHAAPLNGTDTAAAQTQIAALYGPTLQLPTVNVYPPTDPRSPYYDPYTNGDGPRASSLNRIPHSHYAVPPGYDADVAMHPYTSGYGPCAEGASPSQGCHHSTGAPISPSHYNR